jgi:hypothetical protein
MEGKRGATWGQALGMCEAIPWLRCHDLRHFTAQNGANHSVK